MFPLHAFLFASLYHLSTVRELTFQDYHFEGFSDA